MANGEITASNKNQLIERIMEVEYVPNLELKGLEASSLPSFPINHLASLGGVANPLIELITKISSAGGSGLYYVNTAGKTMFQSGGGYIGSLMTSSGAVGGGQAIMTPIAFNPATLATACTIMAIEHKINHITEAQKDITNFLLYKEQAKIKANINTLLEVLNDYKYNSDNEKYKNNKHILVQSIKNESEQSILLLESLIEDKTNKKAGLHFNGKAKDYIKVSIDRLNDLQLGVYQYAFSSFLEIMLLENFDEKYINSVLKSIDSHKEKYVSLSGKVKDRAGELFETSVQSGIAKGGSTLMSGAGSLLEKTFLKKTNLGKKMIEKGKQIEDNVDAKIDQSVEIISDRNGKLTEPFERTLEYIKLIQSNDYCIAFDKANVYLDFKDKKES
ncbi:MAG: hypothetical protein IJS52_01370 [Bacilli bacterium]|nr:hypothetical protein [Bacilli bacterium]